MEAPSLVGLMLIRELRGLITDLLTQLGLGPDIAVGAALSNEYGWRNTFHFAPPSKKYGLAWRNMLKLARTCSNLLELCSRALLILGSNQDPSG